MDPISPADWLIAAHGMDPAEAGARETRFTIGNGYLGTRGALAEGHRGAWPATYIAGVFDRRDATALDLVNAPNWLATSISVAGRGLDSESCEVIDHHQTLDLRRAALHRATTFKDPEGRCTRLETVRFASADQQHVVALRIALTPLNHTAPITLETGVDGNTFNLDRTPYPDLSAVDPSDLWEKWAKTRHTRHVTADAVGDAAVYLEVATYDHDIHIGYALALEPAAGQALPQPLVGADHAALRLEFQTEQATTYTFDKLVALATSRDVAATGEVAERSRAVLVAARETGFDALFNRHSSLWADRWDATDCVIVGHEDATRAIRFNLYHLLIAANPNDPTVSVGAKSLSGEGYKGHVFWDTEIFVLPFFIYTQPDTAKALLGYRCHTLDGARQNAVRNGHTGAQFAWESADTGSETTPEWSADGLHRFLTGEQEVHITADVVYGILTYLQATEDWTFLLACGAEVVFETARFWASRLEHNAESDRYELTSVIGPDEFHEHVDNNRFTNAMTRWNLDQAADLYDAMNVRASDDHARLCAALDLTPDEVAMWRSLATRVHIPPPGTDRVIEQFDGYFAKDDVPIAQWDHNDMPVYPDGYDEFNSHTTTLLKQPDVVMLMYLLGDAFDDESKRANYAFYEARTMHKSSLSPSIHSIMGIEVGDTTRAVQYFRRTALADLVDNQGNTRNGMHIASAGGTWMSVVSGFGGFRVRDGIPTFNPWLPPDWRELRFKLFWRGVPIAVRVRHDEIELTSPASAAELSVLVGGAHHVLTPGVRVVAAYQSPATRAGDR